MAPLVPVQSAPTIRQGERVADDWYRLFGSPVLDGLVRDALAGNPDIAAARARIERARAHWRAVSGGDEPQLDARSGLNHIRADPASIGLPSSGALDETLFSGLLRLSYSVDLFGRRQRAKEGAEADIAFAHAEALGVYEGLVNHVVVAALDLATQESLKEATENIIDALQRQLDIALMQERAGTVAFAETLTLRARIESMQATLPGLDQQRTAAAMALAALLGRAPSDVLIPALRLDDFTIPPVLPASLPSELVRQRPDILAAEQRLRAANARIGVAQADRLPSITLGADFGGIAHRGGDLFAGDSLLWAVGGELTAPILDGGTRKAQLEMARATYREAEADYRATVLRAFSEVSTSLSAIGSDAATLEARNRALRTAKQAMDVSEAQYRAGTHDLLQLLNANLEYRNAMLQRVSSQARQYVSVATLMEALGGGWWNAPSDPFSAERSISPGTAD